MSIFLVLPVCFAWLVQEQFETPYTKTINDLEFWVEYVVWWMGLGIMSSIGMGTGLQSGVLFLFPHIVKVCLAAQTCKTTDFESVTDIWFRTPDALFKCPSSTIDATPTTFWSMWHKILLPCIVQAAGTAIGEIPPYVMARAARLASIESGNDGDERYTAAPSSPLGRGVRRQVSFRDSDNDSDGSSSPARSPPSLTPVSDQKGASGSMKRTRADSVDSIGLPDELEQESETSTGGVMGPSSVRFFNMFKRWTIDFLHVYGFYGVLALASFPNIAFDLCGVCCGHFLMPFWNFFIATLLGKAVIRNSYQSLVYVALCTEAYLERAIVVLQMVLPDVLQVDASVRTSLEALRESFMAPTTRTSTVNVDAPGLLGAVTPYTVVMLMALVFFAASCVEQAAQFYQYQLDARSLQEAVRQLGSEEKRRVTSPNGRIRLPSPSSVLRHRGDGDHAKGVGGNRREGEATDSDEHDNANTAHFLRSRIGEAESWDSPQSPASMLTRRGVAQESPALE